MGVTIACLANTLVSARNPSFRRLGSNSSLSSLPNTTLATSAIPSWCNNIPSVNWQWIPGCGGDPANIVTPTDGIPSWCADIPMESQNEVPSCVGYSGVQLGASAESSTLP